jgi:hypothetical protein
VTAKNTELRESREYYYSAIPWRYSGLRAKAFGIDPLVLTLIVPLFWGLRNDWSILAYAVLFALAILFVLIAFWGYPSIYEWLRAMHTRFIQRGEWKTR